MEILETDMNTRTKKSIPRSIVKSKLCNIKCCVVQNTDIDPLPVNSRVYLGKYLVNV